MGMRLAPIARAARAAQTERPHPRTCHDNFVPIFSPHYRLADKFLCIDHGYYSLFVRLFAHASTTYAGGCGSVDLNPGTVAKQNGDPRVRGIPSAYGRREDHSRLFQVPDIPGVYLVPVPVSFSDLLQPVQVHGTCSFFYIGFVIAQPHRAAKFVEPFLFREEGNDMGTLTKFIARGIGNIEFMAGKFDHCQLEAQTETEEGNVVLAGKPDCFYLSLNTPFAKSTGDQDPVIILELATFVAFGIQPPDRLPAFLPALERLLMLHSIPYLFTIAMLPGCIRHEPVPAGINITLVEPEMGKKNFRYAFFLHFHGYRIGIRDSCRRDNRMLGKIAECGDLAFRVGADRMLTPPDTSPWSLSLAALLRSAA
jgi:hypothetical protein